ncbi:Acyl-coenzyme A thioesterase 11, partial [Kappamyces sp. JEL0680]
MTHSIQERLLAFTRPYVLVHQLLRFYLTTLSMTFEILFFWLPKDATIRRLSGSVSDDSKGKGELAALHAIADSKPPLKSIMTQLITSQHSDSRGVAFAGTILSWMDILAGVAARKHCHQIAVTAAIDAVHFIHPVKIGQICILKASVNRSWSSSMEIVVSVEAEDMRSGIVNFCCQGYFTFVVTNRKIRVPMVLPQTMTERRRYHDAQERRQKRLLGKGRVPLPCVPHNASELESGQEQDTREKRSSITESKPRLYSIDPSSSQHVLSINCSDTYTEVTHIIFPEHCNSQGITFGGTILKFMEFCAAISANRQCRTHLLIASIDDISFLHPTRQGDMITVRSMVSESFNYSMEIYVTVERQLPGGEVLVT